MSVEKRNNRAMADNEMHQKQPSNQAEYGFPVSHSQAPSVPIPSYVVQSHGFPVSHSQAPSAPVASYVLQSQSVSPPPASPQAKPVIINVAVNSDQSRPPSLPCCGIGIGWFLFILGWIIGVIPWYAGALILLCSFCSKVDSRERAGYIACTVMAVIATILIIIIATHTY